MNSNNNVTPPLLNFRLFRRIRISPFKINKYKNVSKQSPQRWMSTFVSKLNLAYDLNSPIFKELLSILSNNSINQETPVKIEQFYKIKL